MKDQRAYYLLRRRCDRPRAEIGANHEGSTLQRVWWPGGLGDSGSSRSTPDGRSGAYRVRAAGVNASDWKKRKGLMDQELPQTMGYEAAGVVDELGEGVTDVTVGDRAFGFCADSAAQAELAVLSYYAPIPASIDFATAAALPTAIETA